MLGGILFTRWSKAFEQRRRFEIKSDGMGVNDPNFKSDSDAFGVFLFFLFFFFLEYLYTAENVQENLQFVSAVKYTRKYFASKYGLLPRRKVYT